MSLLLQNSQRTLDDEIDYVIRHEHIADGVVVPALEGTRRAPTREVGSFCYVWLVSDEDGSHPDVRVLAEAEDHERDLGRIIGTWGTLPDKPALMRQIQTDRLVQFDRNYIFDPRFARCITYGKWEEVPLQGAWPPHLCSAVHFSIDVARMPGVMREEPLSVGIAFGDHLGEGHMRETLSFSDFMGGPKPLASASLRVPIPNGSTAPQVKVAQDARAAIAVKGYELRPT